MNTAEMQLIKYIVYFEKLLIMNKFYYRIRIHLVISIPIITDRYLTVKRNKQLIAKYNLDANSSNQSSISIYIINKVPTSTVF